MVESPRFSPPELIQGGMGVGVSNWKLARAVSIAGEKLQKPVMGVVSGTGLQILFAERLFHQDSDTLRALKAFPVPEIRERVIERYGEHPSFPPKPQLLITGSEEQQKQIAEVAMVANFVEVFLAKEGHQSPIGINYLEKVQLSHLPEIYGAMLAGVDYILMGAGIPNQVPQVLENFSQNEKASYKIDVSGSREGLELSLDPKDFMPDQHLQTLRRPIFLAIISSNILAQVLATKITGVDGFIVEGPTAGGHNAPARGKTLNELGEPIYGKKDEVDLAKINELGRLFWVAGGYASREKLEEAKNLGASGVQVGSAFALCNESGFRPDLKTKLKERIFNGNLVVLASATTSPSGFPFQVAQLEDTLSDPDIYQSRKRICTYGYLATAYVDEESGKIGFRCPAEPVNSYIRKGGNPDDTIGRRCLCVGLAAAIGKARDGESPIVTLGKNLDFAQRLIPDADSSYSAEDVIRLILD